MKRSEGALHAEHRGRPTPGTSSDGAPVTTLPPVVVRMKPSEHDVRRKRPPALWLLLRMDTARHLARVVSLLALDFVAVSAAILTALVVKAAVRGHVDVNAAVHETKHILAFTYLVTALLFARSSLYADRALRPGLARIVACLFQVMIVALIFARRQRRAVLELLHLLRIAHLRAVLRVVAALPVRAGDGWPPAPRRLRAAHAARRHRRAHSRRRARARRRALGDQRRRLHLAAAGPRERPAPARRLRSRSARCSPRTRSTR